MLPVFDQLMENGEKNFDVEEYIFAKEAYKEKNFSSS